MKKVLLLAFSLISLNIFSLSELPVNPYQEQFNKAYASNPAIPKGMLEAVSFVNTRFDHLTHTVGEENCLDMPLAYGVMGLTADGKNYFRSNLKFISKLSGYSEEEIISDPETNIKAFAKAYSELLNKEMITSSRPEDHVKVLVLLSELPNDEDIQNNFALNSHLYAVYSFLNDKEVQSYYGIPAYTLDLLSIFGERNLLILGSNHVMIDDSTIYDQNGNSFEKTSMDFLSLDYPAAIWNPTSCNYSSRNGTSVTAVTVHTVQGSYAGCISWFKNCSASASAHYVVRSSDGQVTQMVREYQKAWHVGVHNPYTIGIEHEGYISNAAWYTNAMYVGSANIVKDVVQSGYGISGTSCYNGPSCNGSSGSCQLSTTYRIKGHQHFSSQTHTDPGINWNWPKYYCLINNCSSQTVAAPPPPTVTSTVCGSVTLSRATPPSGVTYYWQGSSCGTSTANSSATYTVTSSGTYYLRARNSSGTWSTCSNKAVTVNSVPSTPAAPTSSTNTCGSKTLTRPTPPSGVTYYWQGTSCGTSTASSAATYTAASSGTYYLRARTSAGCWSTNCSSVNVAITAGPAAPSAVSVSTNTCGPRTLTRPTPPSGETYYWQGTSCGTSTANSSSTYQATASGTYYLRARNAAGCWSSCTSVSVNIGACPSNLVASTSSCPTTGVTFSWTNANSNWDLEISLDPDFAVLHSKPALNVTTMTAPSGFTPALALQPNATYYWRINVGNSTYFNGPDFTVPFCDLTAPTTSVAPVNGWQSGNFTATFTDADNDVVGKSFYRVTDFDGTEWRGNPERGFFNDNFNSVIHPDWTAYTGTWNVNSGFLNQSDEASGNTNISAELTQNLSNRYLYHWNAKIDGTGTNRRAGFHFFADSASLSNRGNSYFIWFRIDDGKLQFYKVVNDVFTLEKEVIQNYVPGQYYDFKVAYDRITGKMDVYINNVLADSWVDASPISNGKYISFRTGNATMTINNLEVFRSRAATTLITVGAGTTNDIRYENSSPSIAAGKIESIISDVSGNLSTLPGTLVNVDYTAPGLVPFINDGPSSDIATTYHTTELTANWGASSETASGIAGYYYSIGTTPGDSNVVPWSNNFNQLMVMRNGLNLTVNQDYYINVMSKNGAGLFSPVASSDGQTVVLNVISVEENSSFTDLNFYPNPFSGVGTLEYSLNSSERIHIGLYDLQGKQITVLSDEIKPAGDHLTVIEPSQLNISEGMYMVILKGETSSAYFKIIYKP